MSFSARQTQDQRPPRRPFPARSIAGSQEAPAQDAPAPSPATPRSQSLARPAGVAQESVDTPSQPAEGEGRLTSAYPVFMIVFFLVFFSYLFYLQARNDVPTNGMLRGISDLFVLIGSGICAVVCSMTAFKLRRMQASSAGLLVRRAWVGWLCLGGSALFYSIGQIIWTTYDAKTSSFPFPAIYDPFYLAVYPLGWVGIALLIPRSGSAAGRTRLMLDAGIAVASALALSWYFILGPTISSLSDNPLEKTVALAYPLGDLSLCVAAALLIFGPSGAQALSSSIWRLGIGVTWLALTDSLYGYFQLQGVYHTGFLQDVGWPMAWLFIGWGALLYPDNLARLTGQSLADEPSRGKSRLSTASAALRAITPVVLALVTCSLLVLEVALKGGAPLVQVMLVCAGLFLLPVVRQLLTLVDNFVLNDRLRIALDQSQQAFQRSQQELLVTSTRAQQYDELREGIEELQTVHAKLARGDLAVRARVDGALSPVAQSLNLLIERLQRWAQFEQSNRVLESEANRLREALDALSEGHLAALPGARSTLPTGAALVSTLRLQRQLALRFGHLREALDILGTRWKLSKDTVHQAQLLLQESEPTQQVLAAQEALLQVEQKLDSNQALLQDIWMQIKAYQQGSGIETSSVEPR
ncbi:MAG TPA: hypothetical protein VKT82_19480 [Ktedonobacterales bacterium]|nr:hypothetical protein [Ktedonobacterales bacterium]